MRCKQAEQLIIASIETTLEPKIQTALDTHGSGCSKCAGFQKDLTEILSHLHQLPERLTADSLSEQTRALCHHELIQQNASLVLARTRSMPVITSRWLLLTLFALAVLTGIVVVSILTDFIRRYAIPNYAIIAAIVLMQNVIMLLFAPILIRFKTFRVLPDHVVFNGF